MNIQGVINKYIIAKIQMDIVQGGDNILIQKEVKNGNR